jgi:hypothetical protein
MINYLGYPTYTDFINTYGRTNHRVVRIEFLVERANCGCIEVEGTNHNFAVSQNGKTLSFVKNSILDNYFIPTSSDGRGSDISTVGGNSEGFKNLDDLLYFQKALYRSLRYPLSRIDMSAEGRSADIMFGGGHASEIVRDEIRWAKTLERLQNIMVRELKRLFLLHLEFRGLKKQYGLEDTDFHIKMVPPSNYKESMDQGYLEISFNNYNALSNNAEFSKYYLMKKYLNWTDDEIKDNVAGLKKDKELFGDSMGQFGGGGGFEEGGGYEEAPVQEPPEDEEPIEEEQ